MVHLNGHWDGCVDRDGIDRMTTCIPIANILGIDMPSIFGPFVGLVVSNRFPTDLLGVNGLIYPFY